MRKICQSFQTCRWNDFVAAYSLSLLSPLSALTSPLIPDEWYPDEQALPEGVEVEDELMAGW